MLQAPEAQGDVEATAAEKEENSFSTRFEPHRGHPAGFAEADFTSSSKRSPQSRQVYSKIGMGHRFHRTVGGAVRITSGPPQCFR